MDEKKYPRIISQKTFSLWIPTCPLQVKEAVILQQSEGSLPTLKIITCPCGDYRIKHYSAEVELQNNRREIIASFVKEEILAPESQEIQLDEANTAYAGVKITSVTYSDSKNEKVWVNSDNSAGIKLTEQEIYWQTDPLYDQIKRECEGVTNAKYKPDEIDGGWRCTCGQVNLNDSEVCGSCHVSREWLKSHLNTEYLTSRKAEDDKKSDKAIEREIRHRREGVSDKTKAILILSSVILLIVLVFLTINIFIPSVKYSNADKALANGDYDTSIRGFADLGDFRDAKDRLNDATYKKAQHMTGMEEVYMTTSQKEPWYSIDDSGVLSFKKDDYKGSWNNFTIPDVFDGIVVRELDRNFFLNCKELTVVNISDCVEVIGEQAFYNCEILHTINFGKNITEIGARAFINCYELESIEIPDTVTALGLRAFNNCVKLKSVILGSGVTKIGSYQFSLCASLEKITLKSPITEIGEYAFSECVSLKTVFCRFDESEWTEPSVGEGNNIYYSLDKSFGN
ncbi:MAG: leucine-rich repeat domain-containing protein, partial [Eubacteriales bacterium]